MEPQEGIYAWENSATGCFPNNNKRWNYKYKVAFALMDGDELVHIMGRSQN